MPAYVGPVNGHTTEDEELEGAVRDAILGYGTLRIWGHALQIDVNNGIVSLVGYVRTIVSKETAERIVRKVPGVKGVRNNLTVDTELEIAVAQALANDPRTVDGFPGILIGSAFGEIFLKGTVSTPEIKSAASEVAAKVPGVREVVNELLAPESQAAAAPAAEPAVPPAESTSGQV